MHTWTDAQFPEMSWHDNHVHGLSILSGEYGTGTLIFDLDYILEWQRRDDQFAFLLVPVQLAFRAASNLRITLDYATLTAALTPFSIGSIARWTEARGKYLAQLWRIEVNWPAGEITFEAEGFEQKAVGKPVLSERQSLDPHQRGGA